MNTFIVESGLKWIINNNLSLNRSLDIYFLTFLLVITGKRWNMTVLASLDESRFYVMEMWPEDNELWTSLSIYMFIIFLWFFTVLCSSKLNPDFIPVCPLGWGISPVLNFPRLYLVKLFFFFIVIPLSLIIYTLRFEIFVSILHCQWV